MQWPCPFCGLLHRNPKARDGHACAYCGAREDLYGSLLLRRLGGHHEEA